MDFITIIMPCLNEERTIADAISSLIPERSAFQYEILVVDGGSTDGTLAVLDGLQRNSFRIKVLHNPKRRQSAAMNLGAAAADPRAKILVRADCHSVYPPDFIAGVASALVETGAAMVVVPHVKIGCNWGQKVIAAAQNSILGGGWHHRHPGESRFVRHGTHAAIDRQAFATVGGYDETFSHNEDADLDLRLQAAGGRIWLAGSYPLIYRPRATVGQVARQYFNYGKGRAETFVKHRIPLRPRQLMPLGMVLAVLLGAVCPAFHILPVAYLAMCLVWGLLTALKDLAVPPLFLGPVVMVMHFSWAAGFVRGLFRQQT